MALPVDFWNKLNNKQAAKSREYKRLLQSLQAIRPDTVSLLRSPSDESWLGQLVKRGQRFSKEIRGKRDFALSVGSASGNSSIVTGESLSDHPARIDLSRKSER